MSVSFRGSTQNNGSTSSLTVTLGTSANAGNLIVVAVKVPFQTVTSVTDSYGNTYTQIGRAASGTSYLYMHYTYSGGTVSTVTVNLSGSTGVRTTVDIFNGTDSSPLDTFATNNGTSSSPSVNLTPGESGNLIVGAVASITAPSSVSAGSGYTGGTLNVNASTEYKLSGSNSETAPFTFGNSQTWYAIAASFKPASANKGTLIGDSALVGYPTLVD